MVVELRAAVATAAPQGESDLRSLAADVFQERLSGGRKIQFRIFTGRETESRDTAWTWLAIACLACLLAELSVLKIFKT